MAPPRRISSTGPPSILSGGGGDDDQRFAELLRPIKDLTENWQVPLARYLEEYYDELHDIQISLDGQTTKVRNQNNSRPLIRQRQILRTCQFHPNTCSWKTTSNL